MMIYCMINTTAILHVRACLVQYDHTMYEVKLLHIMYEFKQFQSMCFLLIPGKARLFKFLRCATSFYNLVESPKEGPTEGCTFISLYSYIVFDVRRVCW